MSPHHVSPVRNLRWPSSAVRVAAFVCAALLLVAGCTSAPDDTSGDIAIGVLDPLSGSNASQGKDSLNGALLAADLVNSGLPGVSLPLTGKGIPGLGGRKIRIISGDTGGDNTKGSTAATQLVNDQRVVALSGAYQSAVTQAIAQAAEHLRLPFVNGDSSSPALTQHGWTWFFRVGPTDKEFGQDFFSLLKDEAAKGEAVSKIAILHTNDTYGNDGSAITQQLAKDNGATVAADVPFEPTAKDLTSQVQQIRAAAPDVVFVLAYTAGAQLMINAMKALQYVPPAVLAYGAGFTDPQFVASAASQLTGFCRRVAWSADLGNRNPNAAAVAAAFASRYHAPLTENSARAFTAIYTLAQALSDARSTDPGQILSALTRLDIPGRDTIMPWDGVKFDDQHQNTAARGVVEQFNGGQWRAVSPADISSQAPVWPIPAAKSGS